MNQSKVLLLLFMLYRVSLHAQKKQSYVNAEFSFDCRTKLVLEDSGRYFASVSCKGFAHIAMGTWVISDKDSMLYLHPNNNLPVITHVEKKKHQDKDFSLELRDLHDNPINSPSNHRIKLIYRTGKKENYQHDFSDLKTLRLSPDKVKKIRFSLLVGDSEELLTLKVVPYSKIIIYLEIPSEVMGYRGNAIDDSFNYTFFHMKSDGLYDENGRRVLK